MMRVYFPSKSLMFTKSSKRKLWLKFIVLVAAICILLWRTSNTAHRHPTQLLKPLSNSHGKWINLENFYEIERAIGSNHTTFKTRHGSCYPYHIQQATQQKFVIQTSNNTSISPRAAPDLFELLRSKKVTIIGDSISEQIYEALLLSALDNRISITPLAAISSIPGDITGSMVGYRIPAFDVTLSLVKSYRVQLYNTTDPIDSARKFVLSESQLLWVLKNSHVAIINFGMHYVNNASDFFEYKDVMNRLGQLVSASMKSRWNNDAQSGYRRR
ncbi:hypothetical protein BDR26DRAFT_46735 [Obelidium mucronatum]|nr:hypothetical protein BDR26DRAFT_46735 [Obelidium mucronatum]